MAGTAATAGATDIADNVVIAVLGGAGGLPADLTPEGEAAYERGLRAALEAGGKVLREGGDSMDAVIAAVTVLERSEEHTSELQSLMRISYAVFCLNKKNILLSSLL